MTLTLTLFAFASATAAALAEFPATSSGASTPSISLVLPPDAGFLLVSAEKAGPHCWHWVVFPPEKPISRHVL